MAATREVVVLGAVVLLLAAVVAMAPPAAGLSPDLYAKSCPQLDAIVRDAVKAKLRESPPASSASSSTTASSLRGCDASIFLEPERGAGDPNSPNFSLQQPALDLIEDIRALAHRACGPKVSSADIIALATCEAVNQSGGPRIRMPDARRGSCLPDAEDLVALSGGHTVGQAGCGFARDISRGPCRGNVRFDLDGTPLAFDNKYFRDLSSRKGGVLASDQALAGDRSTSSLVVAFATNQSAFFDQFDKSMIRLGSFVPPGGTPPGEIRRFSCGRTNKQAAIDLLDTTAADDEGFAASA
ncbi:hypothetical protein ACP4OV_025967 [Aristida adscensionis]